jgi:anti-sigma factor RsiW
VGYRSVMRDELYKDDFLNAFIDGELDHRRMVEFAAEVATMPELAQRIARLRRDKEMLARVYQPIADQPIPASLLAPFRRQRERRRRWDLVLFVPRHCKRYALVIAGVFVNGGLTQGPHGRKVSGPLGARGLYAGIGACAALVAALWLGIPLVTSLTGDRLVNEALAARDGSVTPQKTYVPADFTADDARDRVVDDALAVPVKVPNLGQTGYVLTAMTVYPDGADRHALQLSYRNAQNHVFTVYLHRSLGKDRFDLSHRGRNEICVWQNEDLGVAMVGEVTPKEMLRLASLTYADLNL